jgi:GTP-binding protein Era
MTHDTRPRRCGYVALIGRPNVGKSTLMNRLVGEAISATADKPQTTRYRIEGVLTREDYQIVFVDTPGLHRARGDVMSRALNAAARGALEEVDLVVLLVEATGWRAEDSELLGLLQGRAQPVLLVVNKIDLLEERSALLAYLEQASARFSFAELVPVSARRGTNVEALEKAIASHLPRGEFVHEADTLTDRPLRFLAAEFVREQAMRLLRDEVPYALGVEIEAFEELPELTRIGAVLWVEREGQKAIVIGRGGGMLKRIGSEARRRLERLLGHKVYLKLWVKVVPDWQQDPQRLKRLGIEVH